MLLAQDETPQPPAAKKIEKVLELHGDRRADPYFWLREKTNPEVIAYLEAENAYTAARMKPTEALQQQLYTEMLGRIQETDQSAPTRYGDNWYYTRTVKGEQYPIYCRRKGSLEAPEEVLVNANELAKGQPYFVMGAFTLNPDQSTLAYTTDTKGDEAFTIYFKDLKTGRLLDERVSNVYYSVVWAEDGKTIFYNTLDAAHRPYKVFRHTLGGKAGADVEVYHEPDERFNVEISKTRSRAFILLEITSATTSEVRYADASRPADAFRVLYARRQEIEYQVAHSGGYFYVRTRDGAKNFRLVRAPVARPGPENWVELLPARETVTVEDVDAFRDHLVVVERDNGLRQLRVQRLSTGAVHHVAQPEPVFTASPMRTPEFDTAELRFNYTSLVTPPSVIDYDMNSRARVVRKQQPVLGGYDASRYTTERLFATAEDGVKIPISLVYRKGVARDGSTPALLYGYGSYGIPTEPAFSSDRLSLLDRGFVYAIAHIRGGGDLGKSWHEAAHMLTKRVTFTDFIACAGHLVAARYTSPRRLAISGASAGGLLMGAVLNLRPDLFGAVVAKVPFVDVLSTMLDATLPLTVSEYEEWGNPAERRYYEYMRTYSPYDNVEAQRFPPMLVTAGLNDPRVSYWEPAKWVARLREKKRDNNLLLLKTNLGAGHFGASGRYDRLKETAFDYAFLLHLLAAPVQIK
jgi:oligopeptidase B